MLRTQKRLRTFSRLSLILVYPMQTSLSSHCRGGFGKKFDDFLSRNSQCRESLDSDVPQDFDLLARTIDALVGIVIEGFSLLIQVIERLCRFQLCASLREIGDLFGTCHVSFLSF